MRKRLTIWFKNYVLKRKMRRGVVTFTYKKVDGTVRTACGTLKADMLPQTLGTGKKPSHEVLVYFDIDRKSWRSFRRENLLTY